MNSRDNKVKRLKNYLETTRFLCNSTDDFIYIFDLNLGKAYFADRIDEKYNLPPMTDGSYTIDEFKSFLSERDAGELERVLEKPEEATDRVYNRELRLVNLDGERFRVRSYGKIQCDNEGNPQWIIGRITDVKAGQTVDPLTGLLDSRRLTEDLGECLKNGEKGFLMVLGIDNFKNINTRYGRGFGNHVLKDVAEILEEIAAPDFPVYRLDSDKYAIIVANGGKETVEELYHQIQEKVYLQCTISSGVTEYDSSVAADADMIYQHAESALDMAKKKGKNTQVFFAADVYEKQLSMIALQEELKKSVRNHFRGFCVYYQPQMDCRTYEIFGAEALLRYESDTCGKVSPIDFIPILEQTELIVEVGEWVLETALEQCKAWRKYLPEFHISINVSYIQLRKEGIAERILASLEKVDMPGEALTLEVTESMQLQDYQYFNKIFYKLEKKGIQIAIDDFGTGYSSLSYLKSIAIDEVKIDRCFVSGIQHSAYNYRLLSNMIELSHSAQIRVCCEGVETEEELMAIEELHPDLIQGFLFAKPFDTGQFEKRYLDRECEEFWKARQQEERYRSLGYREDTEDMERIEKEKLSTIVDGMEELIYVRDMDNYELLYLNAAGRELTGIYDYRGRKCYEVLQGRSTPCEFCQNCGVKKDDYHVWEVENEYLNRHFILKEKLIPWEGEIARLTVAIDVTEKEVMSQKMQEKLDFEHNIVACTRMLVEEADRNKAIDGMLRSIGEFYQSERAYLFELQDNKEFWNNTYEWCAEGIVPQMNNLQDVPVSTAKRWMELFRQGESIVIDNVDDLRENSPQEWETLAAQQIKNLIVSPVWREQEVVGFIGVDNPGKHVHECAHVQTIACFLQDRLIKDQTKDRLNELLNLHYEDILKTTKLGMWVIRMSEDGKNCQMFADYTMREIMGLKGEVTPEECYHHWYDHIKDGYFHYVNYSVQSMIETGRIVELEYTWIHPTKGEVTVRCLGIRIADSEGMICLEGYHREINEVDMPNFLPDAESIIFEFNEKNQAIYFHNDRGALAGSEEREENFPTCWIESEMVHPHFVKQFQAVFSHIQGQPELEGQEFLLKARDGSYDWFKMKTRHLGESEQDADTMVVLLDPAKQERTIELEYMRQKDFYKAVLSETIAYAEIDMESHRILTMGGLWSTYVDETSRNEKSYEEVLTQYTDILVHPEDVEAYETFINESTLREVMRQGQDTGKLQFRRVVDGRMHWVELTGHIFQEQFSENIYALIYMKDIDVAKRRELAQELAATRDPLTRVYNRRAFEEEVVRHMLATDEIASGTLVLIDMDNFKYINDRHGHAEGDMVLKQLADVLMTTFRRKDLIGRMGGDEFLVFLKNVTNKDTIDRRMDELYQALAKMNEHRTTCSVGITFVFQEGFSYSECLNRADIALYKSKEKGKNTYCYYEETTAKED